MAGAGLAGAETAAVQEAVAAAQPDFRAAPDQAAMIVTLLMVAKRFWNAAPGSDEEKDTAQQLLGGIRQFEDM